MKANDFVLKLQRGQIGLVVLLIMSVLLTVGIGVASETVVGQKTSRVETESTETFNAAESAVEEVLGQDLSGYTVGTHEISGLSDTGLSGNVSVQVTVKESYEKPVSRGESVEINLTGSTNFVVKWLNKGGCESASVIITMYRKNPLAINRVAYGPTTIVCSRSDDFGTGSLVDGYWSTPTISTAGYDFARVKVVYKDTTVSVSGTNLPAQTYQLVSQASKTSGETSAIQVDKGLPSVPSIFDYAVFAGQGDLKITAAP